MAAEIRSQGRPFYNQLPTRQRQSLSRQISVMDFRHFWQSPFNAKFRGIQVMALALKWPVTIASADRTRPVRNRSRRLIAVIDAPRPRVIQISTHVRVRQWQRPPLRVAHDRQLRRQFVVNVAKPITAYIELIVGVSAKFKHP